MIEFLKQTIRPSSLPLLLLLLTPGVCLLYLKSTAKWARAWLACIVVAYWALSTPWSVSLLARTLSSGYMEPASAEQVRGGQAIVLLGGGSLDFQARGERLSLPDVGTAVRVMEAARVYRLAGSVPVIASGGVTAHSDGAMSEGDMMRRELAELSVPPEQIVSETRSRNTREQAVEVARELRTRGIRRAVLVTSPLHMPRSLALFRAQGVDVIPAPAALVPEGSYWSGGMLPVEQALWVGDGVVYEWAADAYYWWNGWLR